MRKLTTLAVFLIVAIIPLVGCEETPVKFYVCDDKSEDCKLVAGFHTLWACERYKVFAAAYCDSE
ncbi:MAG TPA: hypothetical protein ENG95_01895, partial [Nitrospirae bacterium]|nr:hypothetical protein [Nitrospirota bacterium]